MSILKVARLGHPVLRTKALAVPPAEIASPGFQQLVDDMLETMHEYSGIGLAAPQVHVGLRVFVAGIRTSDAPVDPNDKSDVPPVVLINPEVTLVGEAVDEGWEGCLSIPDIRGLVPRAHEVRVKAYNREGRRITLSARGLPARVIQHETDHLDGIIFFDRMTSLGSLAFLDEYQRYWAKDSDGD